MVEKKFFIRGLSIDTANKDLYNYFKAFKKLIDYIVIKDENNISKGIGYVTFETENIELLNQILLKKQHKIKGKKWNIIEAKEFIQKKEFNFEKRNIKEKLFVGGLPPSKNIRTLLLNYFKKYGNIRNVSIKIQKSQNTEHIKRYGFIVFENKESSIKVLKDYKLHKINQKWIEVKPYKSNKYKKKIINLYKKFQQNLKIFKRSKSLESKNKLSLFKLSESKLNFSNKKTISKNWKNEKNIGLLNSIKIEKHLFNQIINRLQV